MGRRPLPSPSPVYPGGLPGHGHRGQELRRPQGHGEAESQGRGGPGDRGASPVPAADDSRCPGPGSHVGGGGHLPAASRAGAGASQDGLRVQRFAPVANTPGPDPDVRRDPSPGARQERRRASTLPGDHRAGGPASHPPGGERPPLLPCPTGGDPPEPAVAPPRPAGQGGPGELLPPGRGARLPSGRCRDGRNPGVRRSGGDPADPPQPAGERGEIRTLRSDGDRHADLGPTGNGPVHGGGRRGRHPGGAEGGGVRTVLSPGAGSGLGRGRIRDRTLGGEGAGPGAGGAVWVEEASGGGARFVVELPEAEERGGRTDRSGFREEVGRAASRTAS